MWKRLLLEDFGELSRVPPQYAITELRLNATMLTGGDDGGDNGGEERAAAFYERVAVNLRAALPNLRTIRLGGGYRYDATTSNSVSQKGGVQQKTPRLLIFFALFRRTTISTISSMIWRGCAKMRSRAFALFTLVRSPSR